MIKRLSAVMAVLTAVLVLSSCGAGNSQLPNEIKSEDGKVRIDTPANWSVSEAETKDNLVLTIQDDSGAFAQIFWYPAAEGKKFTAKDYADKALGYYGEDAKGAAKSIKVGEYEGYYFAYVKQGLDKDGNTYTYQGYEYFLAKKANNDETAKINVVEVDIFYRYTDTPPTNDQLTLLRSIAETVQVKE